MKIWDDIGRVKADKVFWKGLAVTNSGSSQNDAANAVYTLAGTLGYTNAERLAIHTRYTAAGYTLPAIVLPVKILSFSAAKSNSLVDVMWTVTNETAGNHYSIERSNDGRNFSVIAQVNAAGNGLINDYSITDNQPYAGINYYRLKETSPSGQVTYSDIIAISFTKKQLLQVYPNPAKDFVKLSCGGLSGNTVLSITDATGKKMFSKTYSNATSFTDMIDTENYPAGIYLVKIINNGNMASRQLTVVK